VKRYPLEDVVDVRSYKKGHNGINIYTLHYKIMIVFRGANSDPLKLMETAIESKCKKQVRNPISHKSTKCRPLSLRHFWAGIAQRMMFV